MSEEQPASLCLFGDERVVGARRARRDAVCAKPRLKPVNRKQLMWRTVDVERLVEEDHPVRAIWELVGRLELSGYYEDIEAVEGVAGRAALDPRLLISLWIYAYSQAVGSAREVSRRCEYDSAYQWLTGMEVINHHTLSDFRVKHKEALDELFIEVLGVLSAEGLVILERAMHDGMKVKANAGVDTFRREEKIRAHLELARQQVEAMGDPRDEETTLRRAKAKERAVREREEGLELALVELEKLRETKASNEEKNKARVSMTDPEARIMKQSDGGFAPSYNVQVTTDESKGVIVGVGVSQSGSDYGELVDAEERVERNMGRAPDQMVVDGGFVSRENILAMAGKGVELIGPLGDGAQQSAGQMNRRGVDPAFYPEVFSYDEVNDTYRCPQGKVLRYEGKEERIGRTNYKYRAKSSDCAECPWKGKCCPHSGSRGRAIVRGQDAAQITAFIEKMQTEEAKEIYRKRGCVAEFPNAWIKSKLGLRQFRLRGLIKVHMEALWVCLTYNIQQWIRLCWRPKWAQCRG
jgi:transposase